MPELNEHKIARLDMGVRRRKPSLIDEGFRAPPVDGKAPDKNIILQIQEKPLREPRLRPCGDVVIGHRAVSEINDPFHTHLSF